MSIGHSPDEPQWTPDMRKKDSEITEAEKKEAKRRIQGNVPLQDSPDGSGEDVDEDVHPSPRKMSTRPTIDTLKASAM
jgi:phosphatidylserine decarboxylase